MTEPDGMFFFKDFFPHQDESKDNIDLERVEKLPELRHRKCDAYQLKARASFIYQPHDESADNATSPQPCNPRGLKLSATLSVHVKLDRARSGPFHDLLLRCVCKVSI